MKKMILLFSLLSIVNNKTIGFCDIKGNVNNPGVYEVKENDTINDVIKKAGGLKEKSYTDNINLSKKVTDEMVIYIHNIMEIEKAKELKNCVCESIIQFKECDENKTTTTTNKIDIEPITTKKEIEITSKKTELTTKEIETTTKVLNSKININTASLEELINLSGLGESKANKIIEYRNTNGFFETIDQLLNVDGIGKKTFENIREYIEV